VRDSVAVSEQQINQEHLSMFTLEGVGKRYPGIVAVAPLSLQIAPGERVALMGPSGSGKSTLLKLLSGSLRPSEGRLLISGIDSSLLAPGRVLSDLVGMMPQSLDLVPTLAVVHNVAAGRLGKWSFAKSLISLVSPREVDRVQHALDRVGIGDKLFERTSHLSGGQQQRVALARLLVQQPHAILADEPVASVDPARAEDLVALLAELTTENEQTLVVSLHTVPLALKYFDRVIALRNSMVVFDRHVDDVADTDLAALYSLEEARDGNR
jgi:phosphonate transport system ATP-binding protein